MKSQTKQIETYLKNGYSQSVNISTYELNNFGRKLTRKEALNISQSILVEAENRRMKAVYNEAIIENSWVKE